MMIISLSGVHGAGKTTILAEVASALRKKASVFVMPELDYQSPADLRYDKLARELFFFDRTNERYRILKQAPKDIIYLCDRSWIDILVYSKYFGVADKIPWEDKVRVGCREYGVLVEADIDQVMKRLSERHGRGKWHEGDVRYAEGISELFKKYSFDLTVKNNSPTPAGTTAGIILEQIEKWGREDKFLKHVFK